VTRDTRFWTEVADLFAAVVDLDARARAAALDAHRRNRPEVCAEVESLLTADADAGHFIEPVILSEAATPLRARPGLGSSLGAFRLVEVIGAGGTGTVYRAVRTDATFAQQAAVKVIATPVVTPDIARRFRSERHILASLSHPNIVGLIDAGLTAEGFAYLVMEYVQGVTIGAYCRDRRATLAERLRLFRSVCSGVHYAHRHAVVHRDLKPANILVSADGVPKVLDFGIARLLDDAQAATGNAATAAGLGPLTLNYASPEQLRGLTVTTSSDVYSLGVLLYELVAGVRPYETAGRSLDEVLRLVADVMPARPSAVAALTDPRLPYPASALRGDLDAIVSRAMRKEPEERYRSAEEIADDIERYLDGVPVTAREPSLPYVLRKLASRYRAAFVTAAISLVVVVAALVVALVQARVATAERRRADRRFGEVRQLANSLIFKIHDVVAPLAGSTPVRQTIVAEALTYLEALSAEAQSEPALQVELARAYIQIGRVQGLPGTANLGDRAGALKSFQKAQALIDPLVGAPDPPGEHVALSVEANRRISETLISMGGRRDEAVAAARQAVSLAEAFLARQPGNVRGRNLLASASFTAALAIGWPDSLPFWKQSGAVYDALLADRPDDEGTQRNVALVEKYLGAFFEVSSDFAQALRHHERARSIDEQRLARNPGDATTQLDVAIDLSNVAFARWKTGYAKEAIGLYERSLAIRQALAERDPANAFARSRVAFVHTQLANVWREANAFGRAVRHAEAANSLYRAAPPVDANGRLEWALAVEALARAEAGRGRSSAACAAFTQAFKAMAAVDEGTRRARAAQGEDLLRSLATEAGRCGVKEAQDRARVP
jgi:non-specific serine/threonine protein kinase/serine/threonine-protein kinase